MVTIYGKAVGCPQCDMTKTLLTGEGIKFEFIDVLTDEHALSYLKDKGYNSVPVTFKDGFEPIVGFRPDLLEELHD